MIRRHAPFPLVAGLSLLAFTAGCRGTHSGGESAAVAAATGRALAETPTPKGVRFDDQRFTVDGVPFFPFGVIWRASGVPLQTYREHHLNIFLTAGDPAEIEEASRLGLKTFAVGRSRAGVARHHANPTLVAWFVADDAKTEGDLADIRRAVAEIRAVDPHRPIFANLIGHSVERNAPFVDVLDVPSPYRYPFPRQTLQWYREYLDTLHLGSGRRAYWTTVQSSGIFSQHRQELGIADGDMRRFLTPEQLRLLVWTVLQTGGRGIFFWPDYGLFDGSDPARARALEVARIGLELEVFSDLLVLGDPVEDVRVHTRGGERDSGAGSIRASAVRHRDNVLVLASVDPPNAHEWIAARIGDGAFAIDLPSNGLPAGPLRAERVDAPLADSTAVIRVGDRVRVICFGIDVTGAWLITSGNGEPWASRLAQRADEYRRLLAESFRVEQAAAQTVIDHVAALGYLDDVPRDRGFVDKSTATVDGLVDLRRQWRRVMTGLQSRAKSRRLRAAPGAENLWMSPYTLPAFYGSLTDSVGG